ncbi:MAG: DUF2459 domain-containing protein [Desulfovibrio sp.]|nr:DUF2459 domain-containing protein [Desulfovibrio sp.]
MPSRPPHPGQPPKPPRRPLLHALLHALTWTLRGLILLPLGYMLAVAVLGTMPRPTDGLPLPVCCLSGGVARNAAEQMNGVPASTPPDMSDAPGTPGMPGGEKAGMADAATGKAPPVTIHVISNGVHADIVLPARVAGEPGLADVLGLDGGTGGRAGDGPEKTPDGESGSGADSQPALLHLPGNAHLAIGWGAREFYLSTPTWDRMRPGVALRALALAPAALHVEVMPGPPLPDADTRILHLSRQGYRNLVAFMAASLHRDADGRPVRIGTTQGSGATPENGGTGYGPGSLFFEATGRFSPVRTCNTWAAEALAAAGARTPVWTPLPHFVLYHLPATSKQGEKYGE